MTTSTMQRRFLPNEIRQVEAVKRTDGDAEKLAGIKGTAAVFYNEADPDGTQYRLWRDTWERIMPGAFDDALARPDDVRALQNHDPRLLLGRSSAGTLTLSVDGAGLNYDIDTPDNTAGRDTVVSLERGDMTGSSFAFIAQRAAWVEETDGDGETVYFRQIEAVELFDVGPVTYPAYAGTDSGVRGTRSAGIFATESRAAEAEIATVKAELGEFLRTNYYEPEAKRRARELALVNLAV